MKFIRKHKILIFLLICLIIGFLTAPLFHSGYIGAWLNTFTYVAWYWHILLFLGILFSALALHELTHFITFLMMGYQNDMIIIFMFLFYKDNDTWHVKIKPKLLILGGGLVWPNLGSINNQTDFNKARKAMQTSLLSAPLFTLISGVIPFLLSFIFYRTFLVPVSVYLFVISMFYTYLSSLEANEIVGDFKAYKRVKRDDDFSFLILLQYTKLSDYQLDYMKTYLENNTHYNKYTRTYFAYLLEHNIHQDEIDLCLYEKTMALIENSYMFESLLHHEEGIHLAQNILFFLYKSNHKDESLAYYQLFKRFIENKKTKEIYKTYLIKQTAHLLKLSDESDYINDKNHMQTSMLSFITNALPAFVEYERKKNAGFEMFKLSCEI